MEMKGMIVVAISAMVLIAIVACPVAYYTSKDTVTITVDKTWIKPSKTDSKYLFSDTDGNVYSAEDSALLLKFDASDRYASLKVGESYEITTYGWRVHFFKWAWYKNAVSIKEV